MSGPVLSIVIAALNGADYLDACLTSLCRQQGDVSAEIIVVTLQDSEISFLIQRKHAHVRLLQLPAAAPQTIAQLRAAGLLASGGDIVALIEDHCLASPNWFQNLIRTNTAHAEPAIGGSVDNAATERLVDWVAFGVEYSRFSTPAPCGWTTALPAANVSYKRAALFDNRAVWEQEFWEAEFHAVLRSSGQQLWSDPALRVRHNKRFKLSGYLTERFHSGRWFAGTRTRENRARPLSTTRRLAYPIATPLLPGLLLVRTVRNWRGKRGPLWQALPLVFLAVTVGAVGEFFGYLSGPGRSGYHLR